MTSVSVAYALGQVVLTITGLAAYLGGGFWFSQYLEDKFDWNPFAGALLYGFFTGTLFLLAGCQT